MGRGVARRGSAVPWPNGIVPYEIASGYVTILFFYAALTQETFIIETMQKMERYISINNVRCIQFRPKVSSDL
ncbi:unnamed protein product, partial [Rotaria sordida]